MSEDTEILAPYPRIALGQSNGLITEVGFGYYPNSGRIVTIRDAVHEDLNDHSQKQRNWLLSLPEDHQEYWGMVNEVDHLWPTHSEQPPVWVDAPGHPLLAQAIADHFSVRGHECAVGAPLDAWVKGVQAGFSNFGKDLVARAIGGDSTGFAGTFTSTSATSGTDSGGSFPVSSGGPPSGVTNPGLVGHIVQAGSVYGVIITSTATVLTVDLWHSMTAPGTTGSTPGNIAYNVIPGGAPAHFAGISIATRVFTAGDNFLTNDGSTISELWFSGGGLQRKLATWAHTNGTATYTLTATWTANGSDTLPQTIAKWANFQANVTAAPTTSTTGPLLFQTLLGSTATLSASGDNVTITDTITES